jgi:hypothetical protein
MDTISSDIPPMPLQPPVLQRQNATIGETIHAPLIIGTKYRLRPSDGRQITAVLTKQGKILEVKNSVSPCQTYDSLLLWVQAHSLTLDHISSDTSHTSGLLDSSDTNGCIYPTQPYFWWFHWVYELVYEASPHLIFEPDFKLKYNTLAELCIKDNIHIALSYQNNSKGYKRYDFNELFSKYMIPKKIHISPSGRFNIDTYCSYPKKPFEIDNAYLSLRDYIAPHITDYLSSKNHILLQIHTQARNTSSLKRLLRTRDRLIQQLDNMDKIYQIRTSNLTKKYQSSITCVKKIISNIDSKIAKLQKS